ncbi:hypothetical protein GMSM_15710 [Geomonas sp. Red276]
MGLGKTITLLPIAAVMSICCAGAASAASFEEVTPYLSALHHYWDEYYGGRTRLKESGAIFALGVVGTVATDTPVLFRGRGEIFGGKVDYDGETQGLTPVPAKTDVVYFGVREELDLAYRIRLARVTVEPFGGIGYRFWLRDLQDTMTQVGPASGYTEAWQSWYWLAGLRSRYPLAERTTLELEGGAKYPFYVSNTVNSATVRPQGEWSAFAEGGVTVGKLKVSLSYQGFRFTQSPLKLSGANYIYQPDSSSDIWGVNVGWKFQ